LAPLWSQENTIIQVLEISVLFYCSDPSISVNERRARMRVRVHAMSVIREENKRIEAERSHEEKKNSFRNNKKIAGLLCFGFAF
jgi:hypothetical protein